MTTDPNAHLVRGIADKETTKGAPQSGDTRVWATGSVVSVDWQNARVQVNIFDGIVWLPANPAKYSSTSGARVQLDPTNGRPLFVMSAVYPDPPIVILPVTGTTASTVVVTAWGNSVTIPAFGGTYTTGQAAYVVMNDWNQPSYAIAPNSTTTAQGGSNPGGSSGGGTAAAVATIGPQFTGTYRSTYGQWGDWNQGRYGGAADIYQGNAYGSGLLQGFAGYGNQIVNLSPVSIQSITMNVKKTDTNGLSANCVVQGSGSGSQPGGAPSSSGDTAQSGEVGPGGWGTITFTSNMCNGFANGTYKGLCEVGGEYGAFGGTSTPGSYVLTIHYTRKV